MNKKTMQETIRILLDMPASEKNKQVLERLGFTDDEANNMAVLAASTFDKALKGNASALKFIQEAIGAYEMSPKEEAKLELEKEKLELEKAKANQPTKTTGPFDEIDKLFEELKEVN